MRPRRRALTRYAQDIFSFFCHSKSDATLLVEHLKANPEILRTLIRGISKTDNQTALIYCDMLKVSCQALAGVTLNDTQNALIADCVQTCRALYVGVSRRGDCRRAVRVRLQ